MFTIALWRWQDSERCTDLLWVTQQGLKLPAQRFQVPNSFQDPELLSHNLKHLRAVPHPKPFCANSLGDCRWPSEIPHDISPTPFSLLSGSLAKFRNNRNSLVVFTKEPSIPNPQPIQFWPFLSKWQIVLALRIGRNTIVHGIQFVRWVVGGQESVWLTHFSGGWRCLGHSLALCRVAWHEAKVT